MAAHRYWRVRFNAANGAATPSAAELQVRDSHGGPHQSGTVTVSSSWNATSNPVSNLFDGNPATWWACNSGINSWLAIDFGAGNEKEIVEIYWQARADSGAQSPANMWFDWSDDGDEWTEYADVGGFTWSNGQSRVIALDSVGEVRVYQLSAEVTHDGAPSAPIRVYQTNLEVTHDGDPVAERRFYKVGFELIRHIADRYNWDFIEDNDYPVPGEDFTVIGATGWGFIDDSTSAFFGFTVQIPYVPAIEKNPYAATLPSDPGETEEYFREQQRILREQHNLTQAGDTTFDYGLLFQTYANEEYTPGSLGRFHHDKFGLIHARFCRLKGFVASASHGKPVGYLKTQSSVDWTVTNDFGKSSTPQAAGIGFFYDTPTDDSFGWIVVNGSNPGTVLVDAEPSDLPIRGDTLGWSQQDKLSTDEEFSLARPVKDLEGGFARAGDLFIRLEPLTDAAIERIVQGQLGELSEAVGGLTERVDAHDVRLGTIDSQIVNLTKTDGTLLARLQREESARQRDIRSIRDSLAATQDWQPEINEMGNQLRQEFNSGLDATNQLANNAFNIATSVQTQMAGINPEGIQSQFDSLVGAISQINIRLTNFTVDWSAPADGQILISTHTDTEEGNPIWRFEGINFVAANLPFTPAGGVAATDVQDAIEELDSEKVTGPSSATSNAIVRWDGTSGKLVKDSSVTVSDGGVLTGLTSSEVTGGDYRLQSEVSNGFKTYISGSAFAITLMARSGGTIAAKTKTTVGQTLGQFSFRGHNGVDFHSADATRVSSVTTEDGATGAGAYLAFFTTPNGGGAIAERLRINHDGLVQVRSGKFSVSGLVDAVNDGAAAAAGVAVGDFYRNGSQVMIRVS